MESAAPVTPGVLAAERLSDLAEVFAAPGPFVSVYLGTPPDVPNAAQQSEARWKSVRTELTRAGAPENALRAIDPLVRDAHTHGATLAAVANSDDLLHRSHHPEPPSRDVGRLAPLPYLAPVIEWRQAALPHVVVLADRAGADLFAFIPDRGDLHREVEGDDDHIHKAHPGGWSQRRFQQRAENQWEKNASEVAERVDMLVDRLDARLLVVAGDVRALQLLQEHLDNGHRQLLHTVDGARNTGASMSAVSDDVTKLVASTAAEDTVAILRKFREEAGQGDRAVQGAKTTLEALSAAQVETLLVHDDPEDERTAYFCADPVPVAGDAQALRDLGADDVQEGRLVDVALRAALGTSAGVRIIPAAGGPDERIGAILRWR